MPSPICYFRHSTTDVTPSDFILEALLAKNLIHKHPHKPTNSGIYVNVNGPVT